MKTGNSIRKKTELRERFMRMRRTAGFQRLPNSEKLWASATTCF